MTESGFTPLQEILDSRSQRFPARLANASSSKLKKLHHYPTSGAPICEVLREEHEHGRTTEDTDWPPPGSNSNRSGYPCSGPSLDRKNGSVVFRARPKLRPADPWQAKLGRVLANPRVYLGWAWPVRSILQFCVSRFTLMVEFRYATVNRTPSTLVMDSSFSTY